MYQNLETCKKSGFVRLLGRESGSLVVGGKTFGATAMARRVEPRCYHCYYHYHSRVEPRWIVVIIIIVIIVFFWDEGKEEMKQRGKFVF